MRSLLCPVLAATVALGSLAPLSAQDVETRRSALLGDVSSADDCSPEEQDFNEEIMSYGRIAAVSAAFEDTLRGLIQSRYRACDGDPFEDASQSEQISRVLDAARSTKDVQISCTGGSGNASTYIGSYENPRDESFNWGGWFGAVHDQLDRPVCASGESPGEDDCRFAAYPWPYSQAAGIAWHEAMHTRGYTHGANSQSAAKSACGYSGDPTWHFQRNTMPYLVGNAISAVISESGQTCSSMTSCPGSNQLRIVDGAGASTCSCVADPGRKGIGVIAIASGKAVDAAILPAADWVGGWHYGSGNRLGPIGDFDGDGGDDFVVTSGWGIGLLTHDGSMWRPLAVKPNGTRFGGWVFDSGDNSIHGVGDFDGDGRDDLLVTSGWGVGLLTLGGSGLTSLALHSNGTRLGGWVFHSEDNDVEAIGDLDGDGRDEIVVTSGWGVGVLELRGDALTSATLASNGTRLGGWVFDSGDNSIHGVGDFDGDGRDDLLVTSGWGVGLLTLRSTGLTSLALHSNGTRLGGWVFDSEDNDVETIGDLDGDGRDEIVVTSGWGVGVLDYAGGSLGSLFLKKNGTWFGDWNYSSADSRFVGVGDFTGDGRDDLVVRSGWGLGFLSPGSSTFTTIDAKAYEKLFGSWIVESSDSVIGPGDFGGDGRQELLLQK